MLCDDCHLVINLTTPHNDRGMYKRVYERILPEMERRLEIPIGRNATYDKGDILSSCCYVSMHGYSFERGKGYLTVTVNCDIPDADTVLGRLKQLDENNVESTFENILDTTVKTASGIRDLKKDKLIGALDLTHIPYSGKDKRRVVGMKKVRGTNYGFCFATFEIVDERKRFCIGAKKILPLDNRAKAVDSLIKNSKSRANIVLLLSDRASFNDPMIAVFNANALDWVVAVRMDKRIHELTKDHIHYDWKVYSYQFKEGTQKFYIVAVKKPRKKDTPPNQLDEYFIYATNRNPKSYDEAFTLAELYRKRWGIETGYRTKKWEFLARTCSRSYVVRLFLFHLAIALYNFWTLINYIASYSKTSAYLKFYLCAWRFKISVELTLYAGYHGTPLDKD